MDIPAVQNRTKAITIKNDNQKFGFIIPMRAQRYRANCAGSVGEFMTPDGKKFGRYLELALVSHSFKMLTFEPYYRFEMFVEIWGLPVAGDIHSENYSQNCSELITFLLHRRSLESFLNIAAEVYRRATRRWVESGMPEPMETSVNLFAKEISNSSIFVFEMQETEGRNGRYFWVRSSLKHADTPLAVAALQAASAMAELNTKEPFCFDPVLETNAERCKKALLEAANKR